MKTFPRRFATSEHGATAIEYGIVVALLSLVIVGAVTGLGNQLYTIVSSVSNTLNH